MKKVISIILSAVMLISIMCMTAYADTGIGVEPGDAMPEFSVRLTDGTTASLPDLLKEKDLVILNIFASWCGPCEREFPDMEEVYRQNKDRMEIISVSGDPKDTMETISDYKASHGLSFPMGIAENNLEFLTVPGFPTTIFIDRSGNVGFVKMGAFVSREEFEGKVNNFLSPEYSGKPLETEKAVSILPLLLILLAIKCVLQIIGRWGIFRKAGKRGWYSLIPFLSSYTEYSVCWSGFIGILAALCPPLGVVISVAGLPGILYQMVVAAAFIILLIESLKLSKAFGKGKFLGVLMALPLCRHIIRLILGIGKAQFQGAKNSAF